MSQKNTILLLASILLGSYFYFYLTQPQPLKANTTTTQQPLKKKNDTPLTPEEAFQQKIEVEFEKLKDNFHDDNQQALFLLNRHTSLSKQQEAAIIDILNAHHKQNHIARMKRNELGMRAFRNFNFNKLAELDDPAHKPSDDGTPEAKEIAQYKDRFSNPSWDQYEPTTQNILKQLNPQQQQQVRDFIDDRRILDQEEKARSRTFDIANQVALTAEEEKILFENLQSNPSMTDKEIYESLSLDLQEMMDKGLGW